ncbi:YheU family protein [Shewanella cyperi]|uniref:YheU family protein n=2 Tax=Shewanella TaxID=22 RepID=A0A974XJC6_9GAMM|nr:MULTISPECIES: YheU family protein [Shewanella]QSX29455.1 YheU family protein [Shewanella cyperi]QSX36618.1 YheU family protein [Shewanella sedimentimangrovi]
MLVPYDALLQLPNDTLDNLIREYLLTQVEDGGFDSLGDMSAAVAQCRAALKRGELVVEYAEEQESIAIRQRQHTAPGTY